MIADGAPLAELGRLYVFITLAAAAIGKAAAPAPFIAATAQLVGLSRRAAPRIAYSVIAAEASIAVLLLVGGAAARAGMAGALLLFLAFTIVLAAALARRAKVHCNCFGGRGHRISSWDLLRNATLIAAAIVFLLHPMRGSPASPAAFLLSFGAALILFLILANLSVIVALSRQP